MTFMRQGKEYATWVKVNGQWLYKTRQIASGSNPPEGWTDQASAREHARDRQPQSNREKRTDLGAATLLARTALDSHELVHHGGLAAVWI